jgi:hypothetical protein
MVCRDCGGYYTINQATHDAYLAYKKKEAEKK